MVTINSSEAAASRLRARYISFGVGVFAALTVGIYLGWPIRQTAFLIVASAGVFLLVRINSSRAKALKQPEIEVVGSRQESDGAVSSSLKAASGDRAAIEVFSKLEAREWLDDFLVNQQKNKK